MLGSHRFDRPATFACGPDSLNAGLLSHWPLTELTGIRRDLLGGYHLMPTSFTATNAQAGAGKLIRAVDFTDTSSSYLTRPPVTFLPFGHDDWAYGAWLYSTDDGGWDAIGSQWAATSNQRGWYIGVDWSGSNNKLEFGVTSLGTTGSLAYVTSATGSIPSNTWTYVYWYHDGVNNLIGVSINGATPTTTAHSAGVHNSTFDTRLGGVTYGNAKCLLEAASFWYGSGSIKSTAELAALYGGGYGNPMVRG